MLDHYIAWASRYQTFVDCCCNVNRDDPSVPGVPGNSKGGRQLKVNLPNSQWKKNLYFPKKYMKFPNQKHPNFQ